MNHNKEQLEQSLLELHYGLLGDAEASELRALIATDADVAALWAKTLEMAGQFADAAKLAGVPDVDRVSHAQVENSQVDRLRPPLVNPVPDQGTRSEQQPLELNNLSRPAKPIKDMNAELAARAFRYRQRSHRQLLQVLTGLAAALFLAVSAAYWFGLPPSPAMAIRVDVESVSSDSASRNSFELVTSRMASQAAESLLGVSANLMVTVQIGGAVLHTDHVTTDPSGRAVYSVPAGLKLPKNATLNVTTPAGEELSVPLEPTRCLTYLNIDKPVYRPGETIRFRSLSLERYSLQPNVDLPIRFEMLDPSGAVVTGATIDGVTDRGVGNGVFVIPASAPGGQYTLVAKSLDGFFPDETQTVQVRNYRVPRFKKDLEFKRRSYGPGELVEADFEAIRAEGGPLANQRVLITAKVDGESVYQHSTVTTASGTCAIAFKLPEHISKGDGQLSVIIDDGGTLEVQSKTIPIHLGKVIVDFFPEGGYLVDGLSNRVYFTARNPLGKPIHIAGEILNRAGKRVAQIETVRDGMGRFEFTPKTGERYSVKIADPIDVTNSPELPKVVRNLPVISTGKGVFASQESIKFEIQSSTAKKIAVQAACRGKLVADQELELKPGKSSLEIDLPNDVEGVIRLTILDAQIQPAIPLVERLVFRELHRKLTVKIDEEAESLERSPGEPVRLSLSVFDENGRPAPAVLGVSVVDDAALSLNEDELPKMPTHFLLTSEIEKPEDLEHANFYLSDSDESRQSLDLLLGTQGWRRFVTGNLASTSDAAPAGFSEQLVRLIELDGNTNEQVKLGNVQMINQQWRKYTAAVSMRWDSYVLSLQWFVLPVVVLLMLVYLMRPKWRLASSVGMGLIVAASIVAVLGCGKASTELASAPGASADSIENHAERFDDGSLGGPQNDIDASFAGGEGAEAGGSRQKPGDAFMDVPDNKDLPNKNVRMVGHEGREENDSEAFGSGGMGMGGPGEVGPGGGFGTKYDPGSTLSGSKLDEILRSRGLDANSFAAQLLDELRFPVREYAHQYADPISPNIRTDFTETLYWQPLLITDSKGKATIRFDLSDSVTTFKVSADAHSSEGRIGTGGGELVSRIPLQIEPKLPIAVTDGDRIDLPVAVINATNAELPVDLSIKTGDEFELVGPSSLEWSLSKQQRTRGYFGLNVVHGQNGSDAMIEVTGTSHWLSDTVRKSIKIAPSGYPVRESVSGVLNGKVSVMLPIPTDAVPGSIAVSLKAYPSPLADLLAGVDSILREPHGCFEQTSATNYPNTMALAYLETNKIANPQTTRRAKSLLDKGYAKLVSFECDKLGYEWFGSDPGHEALSAFGLMQFNDMARVMPVDLAMVARTRAWLLDRRDGNGGFQRNPRHLHVWSVQQQIVDAYVLWALTESDLAAGNPQRSATELVKELSQLNDVARASQDPYLIGLAAASMLNVNRDDEGKFLLDKLVALQKDSGELEGATTVTQSGGISKKVETTAVAVLAWSKRPTGYAEAYKKAAQWLVKNRQGSGGFGSTQATVLALKALVAYSENAPAVGAGTVMYVKCDDEIIGQVRLPSDPKNGSIIEIDGLGGQIQPGSSSIELVAEGVERLPFSIEVLYHTTTPPSDDRCPLALTTKFENDGGIDGQVDSGATIRVKSVLTNTTEQGQPMTVATIGLPGGVEPRVEQLNELLEAGVFDFYELRPREVICYWRTIAPSEKKQIEFDVTAEIPGKYTGPASRAYLYYTAEQKVWTEPLSIEINK